MVTQCSMSKTYCIPYTYTSDFFMDTIMPPVCVPQALEKGTFKLIVSKHTTMYEYCTIKMKSVNNFYFCLSLQ